LKRVVHDFVLLGHFILRTFHDCATGRIEDINIARFQSPGALTFDDVRNLADLDGCHGDSVTVQRVNGSSRIAYEEPAVFGVNALAAVEVIEVHLRVDDLAAANHFGDRGVIPIYLSEEILYRTNTRAEEIRPVSESYRTQVFLAD